jgi:hypothetical protein
MNNGRVVWVVALSIAGASLWLLAAVNWRIALGVFLFGWALKLDWMAKQ